MADGDPIRPSDTSQLTNKPLGSFIDHVMTPGSTIVSPTFLLMVDVTLLSLLFLFLSLLVLTWSPHFVALGVITLGLWGSVKLYVEELRKHNELQARGEQTAASSDYPAKGKDD